MTLEARIKRLERERDHPAHPWPDSETVAHWASLWTAAGLEESRATALALEFLLYCQTLGQVPMFYALVRWTQREDEGDEGNEGHLGCK